MKLSFKRITSSGKFIPEIDGLRFIAIICVVLYHLHTFLHVKDLNQYKFNFNFRYLNIIFEKGSIGVPLFFVISGFILGLPFAKHFILGEKPILLKKYFGRRLTRLEPPYILAMTILFFGAVYIAKTLTFSQAIRSYFCSILYIHNFCYHKGVLPLLNGVAWSLEIEVQFYILAPLLAALLFKSKNSKWKRRLLGIISISVCIAINHIINLPFISIINFIQYFLTGFLLVDLYLTNDLILAKRKIDGLLAFVFLLCAFVFYPGGSLINNQSILSEMLEIISIFGFYYFVLFHKVFKFLTKRFITNIGGMCYSIYLIHQPLISLIGNKLLYYKFSNNSLVNTGVYSIVILIFVLSVSSCFFLLVERPCMKRDWYKFIFRKRPMAFKFQDSSQ